MGALCVCLFATELRPSRTDYFAVVIVCNEERWRDDDDDDVGGVGGVGGGHLPTALRPTMAAAKYG